MTPVLNRSVRARRGHSFLPSAPLYPVEQEHSLELPLGYVPTVAPPRIAVLFHAFHVDLLPEFRAYLDQIPGEADLFVTTDSESKCTEIVARLGAWSKGAFDLRVVPNRGRDVAPKLVGLAEAHDRAEFVLHLHTKSSPHDQRLAGWRGYLLDSLLGSPAIVLGALEAFHRAPRLGMLAPQHIDELRPWILWGDNYVTAAALAERMGFNVPRAAPLDFPSGSMFWARSAALRPLLDLRLRFDDFPDETGQTDGTLAHAIERLYFHVCERAGFGWLKVSAAGELHDQSKVTTVSSPQELDRFINRHNVRLNSLPGREPIRDHPVITSPPPRPRRVLNAIWRAPLGVGAPKPTGQQLTMVLQGAAAASAALVRSVDASLKLLPQGSFGHLLKLPNATRAEALRAGFSTGADLVVLLDAPGLMHPGAAASWLDMSEAHDGRALIAAVIVPGRLSNVDVERLDVGSIDGRALAIPRTAFDELGNYDDNLDSNAAERDYTQRAKAHGFALMLCPRARLSVSPVVA